MTFAARNSTARATTTRVPRRTALSTTLATGGLARLFPAWRLTDGDRSTYLKKRSCQGPSWRRRHYPRVVRVLIGVTGRRVIAEEIAQEALLSAFERWSRVCELDRPDLWVRRAALNRAISLHRRAIVEAKALTRIRWQAPATASVDVDGDDALWAAVRQLPRRQAAAVVLSTVEQLNAAEVAAVLGCSTESARTHLRRGRDRLRTLLLEGGDD